MQDQQEEQNEERDVISSMQKISTFDRPERKTQTSLVVARGSNFKRTTMNIEMPNLEKL